MVVRPAPRARRIPTQLFESALALFLGLVALLAVWSTPPEPGSAVFVGSIAAYTLGRQVLFPLRDLPRHTRHGRLLTATAAGTVLTLAVLATLVWPAGGSWQRRRPR